MDHLTPPAPSGWLSRPFVQSMLSNLHSRGPWPAAITLEAFQIPLRDTTDRLLAQGFWQPGEAPALVVLPGVCGTSDSAGTSKAVVAGLAAGMHVIGLNLRGAGRGAALAKKMYHAGLVTDIEDSLALLVRRSAVTSISLLGFSLGGLIALNFAASADPSAVGLVQAMATISAPFDLAATCQALDAQPYWPFRQNILKGLARNCQQLAQGHPLAVSSEKMRRLRTFREFDAQVTAPMHSFVNAQEYYRKTSCHDELQNVGIPVLSIHACDDPVVPLDSLRSARVRASKQIEFIWTRYGGHGGFIADRRRLRQCWAIDRSVAFLREHAAGRARR